MNANELADELAKVIDVRHYASEVLRKEVIKTLRQQHTSLISDVEVIERLAKEIQVKDEAIFNSEKQAYNLAMQVQNQKSEIEALKEQIKENDVCLKILMQRLDDGTNEHYCLVWEDAYGKLKVVDTYPPPEGSIKLYTHPANPYQSITDTKIEPTVVSYTHPVKELTYEDGIEECAQRAEAYAYMSPNFTALAKELRAILKRVQEK